MEVYSVGKDDLAEFDLGYLNKEAFLWFVYEYEIGFYDGSGQGVALRKADGLLAWGGLGHCSCFGPIEDDWLGAKTVTVEEFLTKPHSESILDDNPSEAMRSKVRELLQGENR